MLFVINVFMKRDNNTGSEKGSIVFLFIFLFFYYAHFICLLKAKSYLQDLTPFFPPLLKIKKGKPKDFPIFLF